MSETISNNVLLSAQQLSFSVSNREILQSINLQINTGEIVGLIGPNGAGKSTLLKCLANLENPSEGHCYLNGVDVTQVAPKVLAAKMGFLAQGAEAHWPLRVSRLIALGRLPYQGMMRKLSKDDEVAIAHAVSLAEVEGLLERIVTTLSGGEMARVMLARLLATDPDLILADEPIASLDPYHQLHILEILKSHAQRGGAVVVVLHDLNHAMHFCDRLILLDQGHIVANGQPKDVLSEHYLNQVYHVESVRFESDESSYILPKKRIDTD